MRFLLLGILLFSFACSHLPKGSEEMSADSSEEVEEGNDDEMISDRPADAVSNKEEDGEDEGTETASATAKKADRNQPLSKDKAEVKERIEEVERESLGDTQKKTLGLYGELKACRTQLASAVYGGNGQLFWDEPGDKLSEKWLSTPQAELQEYQAVLMIVQHRRDYLKAELEDCRARRQSKKANSSLSSSVNVTEGDSDNDERVHQFMCRFLKKGMSLRDFLIQTFSRGMLQLENFDLSQEFLGAGLKDEKGVSRSNGLMFMGWKLVFDRGPVLLNDVISNRKDAKLVAWSFKDKDRIKDHALCLPKAAGHWNP